MILVFLYFLSVGSYDVQHFGQTSLFVFKVLHKEKWYMASIYMCLSENNDIRLNFFLQVNGKVTLTLKHMNPISMHY